MSSEQDLPLERAAIGGYVRELEAQKEALKEELDRRRALFIRLLSILLPIIVGIAGSLGAGYAKYAERGARVEALLLEGERVKADNAKIMRGYSDRIQRLEGERQRLSQGFETAIQAEKQRVADVEIELAKQGVELDQRRELIREVLRMLSGIRLDAIQDPERTIILHARTMLAW